jgi:hypothetical protein
VNKTKITAYFKYFLLPLKSRDVNLPVNLPDVITALNTKKLPIKIRNITALVSSEPKVNGQKIEVTIPCKKLILHTITPIIIIKIPVILRRFKNKIFIT